METNDEPESVHIRRLQWSSRRGLLELDLFLDHFAADVLPTMSVADRAVYERLMTEDDPTLLEWLHDRDRPTDASLAPMVQRIRAARLDPGD